MEEAKMKAKIEQLERENREMKMQALSDAAQMQMAAEELAAEKALADQMDKALKPFASYIDKGTCKITMIWEDGSYKSTYTETLKPADFFSAADSRDAYRKARGM